MISETLRAETRQEHNSIESSVDILECTKSVEEYRNLLRSFYGYYRPIEEQFLALKHDFTKVGIDIESRIKTELLEKDLLELQVDLKSINLKPSEAFTSLAAAMGALYVLEGSTLGGQVIFKSLKASGIKGDQSEICFHNPYGAETMKYWNSFKTSLNSMPENDGPIILEASKVTFKNLNRWLAEQAKFS